MPTTTGSNPHDSRRKRNVKEAYHLTIELLHDLVDLLICRLNNRNSPGTDQSIIELLRRFVLRESDIVRRVPVAEREKLFEYDIYEEHTIGRDHGRPVIRFENARYTNDILSVSQGLIGQKVLIMAHSQRLRKITATLNDGTSLGALLVEPRWSFTEHSIEVRREIKRLEKLGVVGKFDDIVVEYRKYLEAEAVKQQKAVRQLLRVQVEGQCLPDADVANTSSNKLRTTQNCIIETVRDNDPDRDSIAAAEKLLQNISTRYR